MIKRRYAAQSLPRHAAISLLDVDQKGHFQLNDSKEKLDKLRSTLFDNLLCNKSFIKARIKLLGRGDTRPDDVDKTLIVDEANPQTTTLIKQTRENDSNVLYSTTTHTKDIKWSLLFCDLNHKEGVGNRHYKDSRGRASLVSDCLNAIAQYKEELVHIWHELDENGKLKICDSSLKEQNTKPQSEPEKEPVAAPAELMLQYIDAKDQESPEVTESCVNAAEVLLSTKDAWTMKDDSKQVFAKESSEEPNASFISSRSRKGRRKRTDPLAATPLARVLNIGINDLRTIVSIGRSLVELAQFSQCMRETDIFHKETKDIVAKLEEENVTSCFHRLQCSCLKNAIEVLSCTATTLGYILCSSLDKKLDEDDLDESCATYRNKSLWPAALLQQFELTREAAKPLLSIAGILSADAWFLFGKLVSQEGQLDTKIVLSIFERALLILNSPKSNSLNKPAFDLQSGSPCSPLTQYKWYLQSNINHSIGVYLYEQGEFKGAHNFLFESSHSRRQLLDGVGGQDSDHEDQLPRLHNATVGREGNYLVSSSSMPEEIFANVLQYSTRYSISHLPREKFAVNEQELSLSLTLEYLALTHHAVQKYQLALSCFQESLILRTLHVGKHSLGK